MNDPNNFFLAWGKNKTISVYHHFFHQGTPKRSKQPCEYLQLPYMAVQTPHGDEVSRKFVTRSAVNTISKQC